MQTTTYGLGLLLRRVKEQSLTIPQFQRKFIWREGQVKSLIDSISRSYPIGSLLLLDKKPELELASRSIQVEISEDYPPSDLLMNDNQDIATEVEAYILDGQQRTTSIARVFLNSHPIKVFYFDLRAMWDLRGNEETSWIKTRKRGKTNSDRKDRNRLIRADVCLDQRKADIYVSEYMEDYDPEFNENRKAAREAAAYVKGVFETIRNYKIPVISIERDSGLESVCRVFETINSTGTRLRTFDLAVARYFRYLPDPKLRQRWEDALENNKILGDFKVDGERVLQILALTDATQKGRYPDIARSTLLELDPTFIANNWDKSVLALAETYEWARGLGARPETLPNHSVLVAMSAIRCLCLEHDLRGDIWPNQDFIRRWYFSKVLQAGSSQASNYRISQDFQSLWMYVQDDVRPEVSEVKLNPEIVMRLRSRDVRYKSLQCIFSTTIRLDLLSGEMISRESELHDHHIYPQNAHRSHGLEKRLLDSICNRIYISKKSNLEIGEGYPDKYFGRFAEMAREQGTIDGFRRRMADCMIPGDPENPHWAEGFSIEHFDQFCRDRASLIVARVREVVGASLRDTGLTDEDLDEED